MPDSAQPTVASFDQYHDALAQGRLALTRCASCGRWQWYPLVSCPQCHSLVWTWEDVEMIGIVHSWTRVIRPTVLPAELSPPYLIAIIELPQADGARVLALSDDVAVDAVIGEQVRLSTRSLGQDTVLGFTTSG